MTYEKKKNIFGISFFDLQKSEEEKLARAQIRANIKNILPKKCPQCNKIANSDEELEKLFGYRKMGKSIKIQSWCRDCRVLGSPNKFDVTSFDEEGFDKDGYDKD